MDPAGMHPLACRMCGNRVLVHKYSLAHTSVQWVESTRCAEFAVAASLTERALLSTCTEMRESIDGEVRAGRIEVPTE
jgi:hypothetical protein